MKYISDFIDHVICGDAFEIIRKIPKGSIDLVVTDPPFDLKLHGRSGRRSGLESRQNVQCYRKIENISFGNNFDPRRLLRALKPRMKKMNAYFWCSKAQIIKYLDFAIKYNYQYTLIEWHKNNPIPFINNRPGYLSDTEYCVFMREKGAPWNNGLAKELYRTWFNLPRVDGINHPTPKPLLMMKSHILVSSKLGDVVLDPFCGSGTTLLAAKELGRAYIGIDHNEKYCRMSIDRCSQIEIG